MKAFILSISAGLVLIASSASAQDLSQNQIPSVIANQFNKTFPKANDIEWEMEGNTYNVEFETGLSKDHEVWYDSTGKLLRHKEDITGKELPSKVKATLKKDFNDYRLDDVNKITTDTKVTYTMELKSSGREWEIVIDQNGKLLKKRAD